MEPDKHTDEPWYGVGAGEGWYKRGKIGVTDLKKWRNQLHSKAFGAGVTLGTYADNGYTFNGKVLLAIIFPGPIIMLEGKANLLKDRTKLSEDPLFRALAVLDNRAKSLLIGLDTKYKFRSGGELVTISGGTEAFYKINDPTAWHIYLGIKDPRARRIQARLFQILDANAYFMLDAHQLAMGAWVGFDKSWSFPPLSVTLQAWAEGNVIVSFKPGHFYGDLRLHGAVRLQVFRFGLGLVVDASLAAHVFDPFHIRGDFSVSIELPWPIDDISAHAEIEWGPRLKRPPIPIALKDVTIEHFKSSVKWPLPTSTSPPLLTPNYGDGEGYYVEPTAAAKADALKTPPPPNAPVVPLDCRPSLAFGRNVHDDAQIGLLGLRPEPALEWIGDPHEHRGPVQVRYALEQVKLERWDAAEPSPSWKPVAGKGAGIANLPALFGTWAPVPAPGTNVLSVAQNKLLLWSKSVFDHTRHTGSEWGEWFAAAHPDFPCFPVPPPSRICLDFEDPKNFKSGALFSSPLQHRDYVGMTIRTMESFPNNPIILPDRFKVQEVVLAGKDKALCTTVRAPVLITFDQPVNNLSITVVRLRAGFRLPVKAAALKGNTWFGPFVPDANFVVNVDIDDVQIVELYALADEDFGPPVCLLEICFDSRAGAGGGASLQSIHDHNESATAAVWSAVGDVLAPYTHYRMAVGTRIEVSGQPFSSNAPLTQFAFFQTGGPPGLASIGPPDPANPREPGSGLTIPAGAAKPEEFNSGLGDLTRYVRQTVPLTVPTTGEKPLLPRPVYRAYDVGVLFNENYVDLMYRLASRDLSVVLYDRNNLPLRDRSGRLVVRENPWGVAEHLTLSAQEDLWLALLGGQLVRGHLAAHLDPARPNPDGRRRGATPCAGHALRGAPRPAPAA
jgi:hypothetical protein